MFNQDVGLFMYSLLKIKIRLVAEKGCWRICYFEWQVIGDCHNCIKANLIFLCADFRNGMFVMNI